MAALLLQCPTQKKVDFCHLNKSPKLLSFYLVPWHYTYKTISPIKRCKESLGNRTDRFSTCWVCWQPPVCRFESCFFCGFFLGYGHPTWDFHGHGHIHPGFLDWWSCWVMQVGKSGAEAQNSRPSRRLRFLAWNRHDGTKIIDLVPNTLKILIKRVNKYGRQKLGGLVMTCPYAIGWGFVCISALTSSKLAPRYAKNKEEPHAFWWWQDDLKI